MGYAAVSDVTSSFPRFVRSQAGSVADADIQGWIDDASGTVHAAFYQRGLDVSNLTNPLVSNPQAITAVLDQANILRDIVRNYGIWRLASVIWTTLSAVEQAMARASYTRWQTALNNIAQGIFDKIFYSGSATVDILPAFGGVAGAEIVGGDLTEPPDGSKSRSFWKDQLY